MDELKLQALGRLVAEHQDLESQGLGVTPPQADRLVSAWKARRSRSRRLVWASSAVAAAVALFVALWALRPAHSALALRFSFGEDARPGQVGALLATRAEESLPARFSDGSQFLLGPRTRARVQALRADGADLVLEGGAVRSAVVPGQAHLWRLSAGPFTVLVTGTRFDTTWSPEADQFELSLYQGKVSVVGCGIDKQLEIHAGETVKASCQPLHYEVRASGPSEEATWPKPVATISKSVQAAEPQPAVAPAGPSAAPPALEPTVPAAKVHAPASAPSAGAGSTAEVATGDDTGSWRALIRANRYGDAVTAAAALGFQRECEVASVADLKALADAAYFSSDTAKAELAYGTLRRRFAGTPQAAVAAYSLGRLEFDMRGNYGAAARWFQTYLAESPNGGLSREALGRLMESRQRSGDLGAAQEAARRYLASYPQGPHAAVARRLAEAP